MAIRRQGLGAQAASPEVRRRLRIEKQTQSALRSNVRFIRVAVIADRSREVPVRVTSTHSAQNP